MNKTKWATIWKWIIKPFLWIAGITGTIIGAIFGIKKVIEYAQIVGKIDYPTSFIKVSDTELSVYDRYANDYRKVTLPIDRRTDEQIKADSIEAAGISEPGGKVNVTIKHTVTDRHMPIIPD